MYKCYNIEYEENVGKEVISMKKWVKRGSVYSLAFLISVIPVTSYKKAEAASFQQILIYGAAATALVSAYYNNLNENGQQDMLSNMQQQTGVLDDKNAQDRIKSIQSKLMKSGLVKHPYQIYANPKMELNAFCALGRVISINKGMLDLLDDDEIASIMGHEMAHGENSDVVTGITRKVGVAAAVSLYVNNNQNDTSRILSGVAGNMIYNEVFTMEQEWKADNGGFNYVVASGFNPGAPAASMVKIRTKIGENFHQGIVRVVNPNNHPKTTDRVNNFASRLTEYSNKHVSVKKDKIVLVDGQVIVSPVKTEQYLAEERAYLIAGNLATVFHNQAMEAAYIGDDGGIYCGNKKIMTPIEGDGDPNEIVMRINIALGK